MSYIERLSEKKMDLYLDTFKSVAIVDSKFSDKTILAKSDIYLALLNINENKTRSQLNPSFSLLEINLS